MDKLETAIKKLIKSARKTAAVTLAQLNDALPDDSSSPEQIEAAMAMIEEAGLELVEEIRKPTADRGRKRKTTKASKAKKSEEPDPFESEDDDDDSASEAATPGLRSARSVCRSTPPSKSR